MRKMQAFTWAVFVLIVSLGMAGCGSDTPSGDSSCAKKVCLKSGTN
jgi:hypothetical protein